MISSFRVYKLAEYLCMINPYACYVCEMPLQPVKIGVWYPLTCHQIMAPHLFHRLHEHQFVVFLTEEEIARAW